MSSEDERRISPERIQQFAFGFAPPLILEAALRYRVFDILDESPKTVQQVAAETGASTRGLRALLNGLVGLELLARDDGECYKLTEESAAFLVGSKSEFQGGMFQHISRQLLPNWLELTESVRSGRPASAVNQQAVGGEFFQQFVEDLFPRGYPAAKRVAQALRIDHAQQAVRVLDLAAGSGVWSIALAEASNHVTVTAVDWPEVIPVTRKVAGRHAVADRYRFVEGDLMDADFGTGHDVATLGHILHSEGEQRSRRLLARVFQALAPNGTVVIAEMVPNEERTGPPHALIFALNMLVHTEDGDTFTFSEMGGWLEDAGFVDVRQLEAPAPSPLILATKPAAAS